MGNNAPSTEALTRKLDEILTDTESDVGQFCFEEETIEEVMQELYKEIIMASPPQPPSPTPTPFPSSSNASLLLQVQPQLQSVSPQLGQDKKDQEDFDDEWLARVLNWGQLQLIKDFIAEKHI
ncbi:hypothetical protein CR513_62412, partial [Mucuna pruriens]